jgi:L-ascorbate metabolism protein UlaG (beta-lactamase superfamily)
MLIQWFGHSSFLIISSSGTKIITDPYEPGAFGGTLDYKAIGIEPDIVTVSHEHADHNYVEGLPDHFELISHAGSRIVRGIEFRGIETYHDRQEGALRGLNIVFVMHVDRMRLCHLGDLGYELGTGDVERIGPVDILFVPVGGYYTIGPEIATQVIERLNPKIAVPMHYKTDRTDMPIKPVDDFLTGKSNVRRLSTPEFEITKEQLPDTLEIVIPTHSR